MAVTRVAVWPSLASGVTISRPASRRRFSCMTAPSEPRDAELPIKARPSLEDECAAGSDRLGCDCASDARGPLEARAREPDPLGGALPPRDIPSCRFPHSHICFILGSKNKFLVFSYYVS